MSLKLINEWATRRLRLSKQQLIGCYVLGCVLLMLACGYFRCWALGHGIELAPIVTVMLALIPAGLVALSIPAISWLYSDFLVRLTRSFYVRRDSRPCLGELGQLPNELDRPPRSRRQG